MRFPKRIKFRKFEAVIYGRSRGYAHYRAAHYANGRRIIRHFRTYALALKHANETVRDLANGSMVTALTPAQARDAIAAFDRLEAFRQKTGCQYTLNGVVGEFLESLEKLNGNTLSSAITGFLAGMAIVKKRSVAEAVEEFITSREPKTKSFNGERPELSKEYHNSVASWLRKFAKTFLCAAVSELTKDHVDLWASGHAKQSAKTRNAYVSAVRMFIDWCARKKDYLPANHRLLNAQGLEKVKLTPKETEFYSPAQFRKLLDGATGDMLPIIAVCGLAGLRLQEALRLTWEEVFASPGDITLSATKSKTRSRRLIQIVPALEHWLKPYRKKKGALWSGHRDTFNAGMIELREKVKVPMLQNGLRNAYCTYHFAKHSDENLTAAQAGNSPQMIHQHYKGLATKAEAEKWFGVVPLG